eukprot:11071859-Lingulodinium_polyedra.AAC.1
MRICTGPKPRETTNTNNPGTYPTHRAALPEGPTNDEHGCVTQRGVETHEGKEDEDEAKEANETEDED